MFDPSAITNSGVDLSIPHQLRDEVASMHRQLHEIQARIAELQLDTSPEPCAPDAMETAATPDTITDETPELTFAELRQRLTDRLRILDAELKEDNG
jgi:hypothetical protein